MCVLYQVRNEAGQLVLAGPKKGGEEGSMYKRWAKHNKATIMATGMRVGVVVVWCWVCCA